MNFFEKFIYLWTLKKLVQIPLEIIMKWQGKTNICPKRPRKKPSNLFSPLWMNFFRYFTSLINSAICKSSSRTTSLAQALVPTNMNTNLCNNIYLLSPPTAAAQEKYTSFQILYIEYCMNTVNSHFHSSQTLYFPIFL